MCDDYITYRSGYAYQLSCDYCILTSIVPKESIDTEFISLDMVGRMVVKKGYAWDGTSGPVIDTRRNLRASLVHDALYQLMRLGLLSSEETKDAADYLFYELCRTDGVSYFLAAIYLRGLKMFGRDSTEPRRARPTEYAPKRKGDEG